MSGKSIISAHADYRHNDYVFARQQSRALKALAWEDRIAPLHSWSQMLTAGIGLAGAAVALFEVIH